MKVISGGQTGIDRIGLEMAKKAGIPTGGTAPKNWWTETGSDPTLSDYGLVEAQVWGYPYRTEQNVINSDGTVLFGEVSSRGCKLTIALCKKHTKPHLENPSPERLNTWLKFYNIEILNVAGNRASNLTEQQVCNIKRNLFVTFKLWLLNQP